MEIYFCTLSACRKLCLFRNARSRATKLQNNKKTTTKCTTTTTKTAAAAAADVLVAVVVVVFAAAAADQSCKVSFKAISLFVQFHFI